jgi:hypothetical protein
MHIDITSAETLVYLYADPHGGKPLELEVEDPKVLRVMLDGGHEITEHGDVVTVMPAGWLRIECHPRRAD